MASLGYTTQDIFNAANQYGIPSSLFASLINTESGYNPAAISSAGAIGLTQLLPGTASDLGVNPYNPQQNLLGGANYLSQQFNTFGNWTQALEAYNAGPSNVQSGNVPQSSVQYANTILQNAGMNGMTLGQNMKVVTDPANSPQYVTSSNPSATMSNATAATNAQANSNTNAVTSFITSHAGNWGIIILGAGLIFAALIISNKETVIKLGEAATL